MDDMGFTHDSSSSSLNSSSSSDATTQKSPRGPNSSELGPPPPNAPARIRGKLSPPGDPAGGGGSAGGGGKPERELPEGWPPPPSRSGLPGCEEPPSLPTEPVEELAVRRRPPAATNLLKLPSVRCAYKGARAKR
jgi:hypothetical protein